MLILDNSRRKLKILAIKEILSFEPMASAYKQLLKNSKNSESWKTLNKGFSNKSGKKILNISKNSVSSSILRNNKKNLRFEPDSKYIGKEVIDTITLNQFFKKKKLKKKIFLLKLIPKVMKKNFTWSL